jgi:streptomycin 3"-adenylyltransferase
MTQYTWPTCPPGVRDQVARLVDAIRDLLAENLVGVCLHGSLAAGGFNPLRSDLDLLAVARDPMAVETKRRLAELLLAVSRRPCPVEVSFLCPADLVPWRHPTPYDFHYGEDWREIFVRDLNDGAWREWNAVRRCDGDLAGHITVTHHRGVVLHGAPIAEVFPAVPERDFLASILDDVLSPGFGLNSDLARPVYVVLNACRTYAYLRAGALLSKHEGGAWALGVLPPRFHPVVAAALDAYGHQPDDGGLDREGATEFAIYMREEIERLLLQKQDHSRIVQAPRGFLKGMDTTIDREPDRV